MANRKLKDEEIRPRTSAHRYRYANRRKAHLVYFTDEEFQTLTILTLKYQANKSALIRNALNIYFTQEENMTYMLREARKDPCCYPGLFKPFKK